MASTTKSPARGPLRSPFGGDPRDRPGYSLQMAYQRAREQHARMRRERLAYTVPRAALRAFPIAAVFAVLVALGLGLSTSIAVGVFLLIELGWPLIVIGRSFDPVPEIEALREGAEAERKTASAINRLRRYGYVIMHDRSVPGSAASVGHLLVGPGGVMVIKSDASTGTVRYAKDGGKDGAKVDGQSLRKPLDLTKWLGDEVRARTRTATPMIKIPVTPILAMVEAGVLWSDGAVEGVTVISLKDLVSYIRGRPDRLNPAEVTKVLAVVQRLFPPYSANPPTDAITVDRDQWLILMDALRTIRERGGDATDMLDQLAKIENDLTQLAETSGQSGILPIPTNGAGDGDENTGDGDLISELTSMAEASPGRLTDDPSTGRRRGRVLAAVRPLRSVPRQTHYDDGDGTGTNPAGGHRDQGAQDPGDPFSA
ncbi:nuclease-related domain-containing protein [Frankia sp. Cj3]|uniref:nuclease-related domain-containing protein n=3 Tax=unclassified Frankia TaxID=2632575 RepID=UPI001EF6DB70|nr:nuclease-related domain-containing protein [Frankia sp. Cj3]